MIGAAWSPGWLYLRCLLWGLATGAAAGAGTGALVGADSYVGSAGVAVTAGLLGAAIGALVALLPSLLGAFVVTEVVRRRHPLAVSTDDLRRDLGLIFGASAGAVNVAAVLAIVAAGDAFGLLLLLVGDICGLAMLWGGRASITTAWAGATQSSSGHGAPCTGRCGTFHWCPCR